MFRLKENAVISINGPNIQNSPYVEEETEIVESKTGIYLTFDNKRSLQEASYAKRGLCTNKSK